MASFFSPQLKRLLGYVRPYWVGMAVGVLALAIMAAGEFAVTLMIIPIFGRVLNPASVDSDVKLELPLLHRALYVNHLFPPKIHNVWTVVAISLLILYAIKSASEFIGISLIQYIGNRAITDLRDEVYRKIIRQPM